MKGISQLSWMFLLLFAIGCSKDDDGNNNSGNQNTPTQQDQTEDVLDLPDAPFNYSDITLPDYFNAPNLIAEDNTPNSNPITDEGATLGRILFYDKNLSLNNTISCASCHKQDLGFSDDADFSIGFEGGLTGRNSMGLSNAKYYANGHFFWDERAETLEDQVLMPIQDHIEMGMTLDSLVDKLGNVDYYKTYFQDAFGDSVVTSERISLALAQFVRSIVSYQSKYDEGRAMINGPVAMDQEFSNFTDEENRGMEVFRTPQLGGCGGCHTTDLQVGVEALNNGLDATTTDAGLASVTNLTTDEGKFKVPSLRNIALTGPFMHDGRFETLEEVIEHYNSGVQNHPNLDNRLRGPGGNGVKQLNLSESDKQALVAFLHTLTDPTVAEEEKYSDPFK